MGVDRKEMEELIAKAVEAGATLIVERDEEDFPLSVSVCGMKGVGPYPMASICFAERMREVLR